MRLNRDLARVRERKHGDIGAVAKAVGEILADVQSGGDAAVRRYAEKFDGYTGESLLASPDEIEAAARRADKDFIRILNRAKGEITAFHANQAEKSWSVYKENGAVMGQIVRPLKRVGLYVPGGTAAYPSTVLMNAIPASLAGVRDIAIFTPAKADGRAADAILAAAYVCGIKTVYKIGGAHAVGAAAYGTESIPRVDKIVGPGNIFVAAAKKLVYGEVDIDMIAGPSEVLIIADDTANPAYIAADMMSQAEHDEMAGAVLVSTSERVIEETERELDAQLARLGRRDTVLRSLASYGAAALAGSIEEAFEISNAIAPEHLEILTENPMEKLPLVENAGSVFLGENTPEPLGDYMSGTNHVLPTGGTARFYSPLGVYDFVKYSSFSFFPRAALAEFKDDVMKFARAEGLDAHANSVAVRFGG